LAKIAGRCAVSTITATDAKNRFGQVLEMARTEPVRVQKNGRDVAIVISPEEFARYQAATARPKVRSAVEELLQRSIDKRKSLYEALAK
jgi:prevent-host-death family protein